MARIGVGMTFMLRIVAIVLCCAFLVAEERQEKPEKFSPLGFFDLLAYEQAYPAVPGSAAAQQANASKYWVFQGLAYRGLAQANTNPWQSLGPLTNIQGADASGVSETISGRVSALAVSPLCSLDGACRMWVGTAGGGVWRTDAALDPIDPGWRWIGRGLGTNNIGSLTVDPNDPTGNTIVVGTGETNSPNNSGAGTGVYRSTDGGDHWTRVPTMIVDPVVMSSPIDFTFTRGVSAVAIEPGNSQVMYVATATAILGMTAVRGGQSQTTGFPQPRVGLYKTTNGGSSWTLLWRPPLDPIIPANPNLGVGAGDTMIGVKHVKLDPKDPHIVYATAWNNAIHRSAPSLENGDASFKPVFAIVGALRFQDLAMFDLAIKAGHTRLYVYNGTADIGPQALYRLDNADVPASSLVVTDAAGTPQANTASWTKLSSDDANSPGLTSRRICGAQCFYDLVVATPPGQPDTVIVGGVATPSFSMATIRSTDAGVSFSDISGDAQDPRSRAHVDVRAISFHPRNPSIVFVGSDGGVVRTDGTFRNISDRCSQQFGSAAQCSTAMAAVPGHLYFMNRGLQTLQFYNVSIDPKAPLTRLIGGLQDNSTIWQDGSGDPSVWKTLFSFGDGTSASGFHPAKSDVVFASFQSNRFFTNFRNGDVNRWVRTDDPIRLSNERSQITASTGRQFLSFDQVNPDTQFTGFQHVWRTQRNGGDQTFLESTCLFPAQGAGTACGDWVPLGVAFPFAAGSTTDSASRKPGDLTSDFYGADRANGIIVAAARASADAGTLWCATNFGRLFVAKNADGPSVSVDFVRIDTPAMPNRFVTRIIPDRADPNVALISYSGFNTLTPSTPGHIFRAAYDPSLRRATFSTLDFDLVDIPINTIAFDDMRGDLYAATDFGPLVLPKGAAHWEVAGLGFPEALMVDLQIAPSQRVLVAATHGLGIFFLPLR